MEGLGSITRNETCVYVVEYAFRGLQLEILCVLFCTASRKEFNLTKAKSIHF